MAENLITAQKNEKPTTVTVPTTLCFLLLTHTHTHTHTHTYIYIYIYRHSKFFFGIEVRPTFFPQSAAPSNKHRYHVTALQMRRTWTIHQNIYMITKWLLNKEFGGQTVGCHKWAVLFANADMNKKQLLSKILGTTTNVLGVKVNYLLSPDTYNSICSKIISVEVQNTLWQVFYYLTFMNLCIMI